MFKVGDKVVWCGVKGVVVKDYKFKSPLSASLEVEFEEFVNQFGNPLPQRVNFSYDGRLLPWHKEPSLKLESEWKPAEN